MCGIAGINHFDHTPISGEHIYTVTNALAHRGPNGSGVWINEENSLALVHRRLSILDLSEAGSQPMSYASGRYWITLNGEIYNFLEIRQTLKSMGYIFQSDTDTEVILASYQQWGEAMLDRFNGMWAFAIYDNIDRTLFLSRDRFGVKPLYYYHTSEKLIFASEVQAIHKILGQEHPLDQAVIQDIVKGQFNNHGTNQTYLQDVFTLPGGYTLTIRDKEVTLKEWYKLKKVQVPNSLKGQAQALKELLQDACHLRLRSDVPVGTCLSGGLDSSSITATIRAYRADPSGRFNQYTHRGFCASFPGTTIDESKDAIKLAQLLESELDIVDVEAPSREILEEAMRACDGPMHALAFYPIWYLYRYIKQQGITVTLDGQGPDEMLGGYRPIEEALNAAITQRNSAWFWDVFRTYAAQGETDQFSSRQYARKTLKTIFFKRLKRVITSGLNRMGILTPKSINPNDKLISIHQANGFVNELDESLYRQFFQSPLPGILNQYDRCSMAHAVECRMPFMDYRIVEFVFSLPAESKVGGGYTKRVLREAMADLLPDSTRLNKFKIGFNAPIVDWFRGPLREFMQEQMECSEFLESHYFDGKQLKTAFERFLSNPNPRWDDAWKFWPPVHLTWWLKNRVKAKQENLC
jgi:asparagine synthase (glutamine-hydrolysing)